MEELVSYQPPDLQRLAQSSWMYRKPVIQESSELRDDEAGQEYCYVDNQKIFYNGCRLRHGKANPMVAPSRTTSRKLLLLIMSILKTHLVTSNLESAY